MEIEEIKQRLDMLFKQIEKKRIEGVKLMDEIEVLCREAIALQKQLDDNVGENKSQ